MLNKNAFQQDAYRPLIDRMPESASWGESPSWGVHPSWGGVPPSWGVSFLGGASFLGGVSFLGGRASFWVVPPWGVPPSWGVSLVGGLLGRGVSLAEGVSQHALRQTTPPPPVNRITHRCKNITLATTSLRPVTSMIIYTLKF